MRVQKYSQQLCTFQFVKPVKEGSHSLTPSKYQQFYPVLIERLTSPSLPITDKVTTYLSSLPSLLPTEKLFQASVDCVREALEELGTSQEVLEKDRLGVPAQTRDDLVME